LNKMFYPKLAISNLKKNASTYLPYILTCICSIITFYTMITISSNKGLNSMPGHESLITILSLGTIIIGIFSVIFLFYTNSFLIKRRKKELGLYSILGMGKRHIAKVLFFETLFTSLISLVVGLLGGTLIGKLLFLVLLNMLHLTTTIKFSISTFALGITTVVFCGVFLLTLLTNFLQVKLTNPINLLKGGQLGEKEPKTSWILTIIGVLALGSGYYIALTVKSPLAALTVFFLAVLLVIIGTYALFTAGSIALLKVLKRNKKFYYRSKNFVSVSGMIYRMKQNAVGLANICILSTMVLVTISTTVSLYIGKDDMLRNFFPSDVSIVSADNTTDKTALDSLIKKEAGNYQVTIKDKQVYRFCLLQAFQQKGQFSPYNSTRRPNQQDYDHLCDIQIIPQDDYNKMTNKSYSLRDNEVLIFSVGGTYGQNTILIGKQDYKIKSELQAFPIDEKKQTQFGNTYYLIVKDVATADSMVKSFGSKVSGSSLQYSVVFNLVGNDKNTIDYTTALIQKVNETVSKPEIRSLQLSKADWYAMYGGFLFLGVFLGVLFMMATVLIIYFKQISEGYEDHNRFEIMQKVGMDKQEVKRTIRKQILMVFFLPLIGAIIHVAFAFKVITKLLAIFNLSNITLILICTIITALVYAALYALVYSLTARTYYKLVK
jgi:putative ABC transport system permease protein